MKFLYQIILSTFLVPFALAVAAESTLDKGSSPNVVTLRIEITPKMSRFPLSPTVELESEAKALGIPVSPEMDVVTLVMDIFKTNNDQKKNLQITNNPEEVVSTMK